MQNSGTDEGSKAGAKDSKSISSELAAVIDDGLYFYEQVEALAFLIHFTPEQVRISCLSSTSSFSE